MELFYSHASPYARTCRVMLREKGLLERIKETEVNPLENPPHLFALNPLGKIPCLILDDKQNLFDSTVINDYLNTIGEGDDLFAAHQRDWQVKKWQALSHGMLDVAVQLRIEKTKPEAQQSALWMNRNRDALMRSVRQLETDMPKMPCEPCFLGLHIACALGYLDFRHAEIAWRSAAPKLSEWFVEVRHRPSLMATEPR